MTTMIVIGYGSLMSGHGLRPLAATPAHGAFRVALSNAKRGFGKYAQRGDHYAMVLEPSDISTPIRARSLAPDDRGDGVEALAIDASGDLFTALCSREGYPPEAGTALLSHVSATNVGVFLWNLLNEAERDIARFRERLVELTGYATPHYTPHPVPLDDGRCAVTFLAAGHEGSGDPATIPVRVATGHTALLRADEAWAKKPNDSQRSYFKLCLLAALHGIRLHDAFPELAAGSPPDDGLIEACRAAWNDEHAHFLRATGLDAESYQARFGSPRTALVRGGLAGLLLDA